ncbi:MAG: undecaprenyl-diphosphatase [Paracoccaceae bacterium]|jgi:undecaprenyl-diphosphatase
MPILSLVLLAIIQGVTEFLPISSSGHLALFPALTGQTDQGLLIDVSLHVGTLAAVMVYFRKETAEALRGTGHLLTRRWDTAESKLAFLLALATVPVVIAGGLLSTLGLTEAMRSVEVIAWASIVFGIVLWIADMKGAQEKVAGDWRWRDAAIMGLAQAVALIPGTSRSGITMTAARGLGYTRVEAARLSLLMSIPTILASGILATKDLVEAGDQTLGLDALIGAGLSFVAALLALTLMMRMLRTWSMTPFVIYRVALGVLLLVWVYA